MIKTSNSSDPFEVSPVTIERLRIRLIDLEIHHGEALSNITNEVCDFGLLSDSKYLFIPSHADIHKYIKAALTRKLRKRERAFVIALKSTGEILGTTRILNISRTNLRAEIGSTWIKPQYWRGFVNAEVKLALLSWLFDQLNYERVEFHVHPSNVASVLSLESFGARLEGCLRNYYRIRGVQCDCNVFSVVQQDWLAVKIALSARSAEFKT